jgi:hypothetical protein
MKAMIALADAAGLGDVREVIPPMAVNRLFPYAKLRRDDGRRSGLRFCGRARSLGNPPLDAVYSGRRKRILSRCIVLRQKTLARRGRHRHEMPRLSGADRTGELSLA